MFPMISTVDDIIQALHCLEEAHRALKQDGIPHRWPLHTAMMVETPAAALLTSAFVPYVDYFSIGTNDLIQYTFAAERGNPHLLDYHDGLHPAILHLIHHVVEVAHQHGKQVGVCGELAGESRAVPILAGMGVDELSLNPGTIPQVKAIIRTLEFASTVQLAQQARQTTRASEARCLADTFFNALNLPASLTMRTS
jgi:phosphoenolpyruvate-protein kinase (PTS system EI component)